MNQKRKSLLEAQAFILKQKLISKMQIRVRQGEYKLLTKPILSIIGLKRKQLSLILKTQAQTFIENQENSLLKGILNQGIRRKGLNKFLKKILKLKIN